MTKVTKNQKAMFLNIHASTNMPQNVVSKNLKKLQGKRVNPQLYQDILNIYLSIIDRTNKTSERGNMQRRKVDQWLLKARGEMGLEVIAEGYAVSLRDNGNVLKLIMKMVNNSANVVKTNCTLKKKNISVQKGKNPDHKYTRERL